MEIHTKRVYEEPGDEDGYRVLVDRLWPRGLSKEKARVDLWAKEVAPTAELRKAFHHEDLPYEEFVDRYEQEMDDNPEVAGLAKELQDKDVVTLLYAMKSEDRNHALLLRERLK